MSTHTAVTNQSLAELIDLGGKTATVTGGAVGIGRGIASRLHEAGAAVVIGDLDAEQRSALAEERITTHPSTACGA